MSYYNWIEGKDFSIDHFFLMDRWILEMIFMKFENKKSEDLSELNRILGTLIKRNNSLIFYIKHKAPKAILGLEVLLKNAFEDIDSKTLRIKEIELMEYYETDIIYTEPKMMDEKCNYITAWDSKYLYELVDLKDKIVLDLGAGTGRLSFAASRLAKRVYASEPTAQLRDYMNEKIKALKITNMKVLDGVIMDIPYEDDTFDVVTSGHVVGDDYDLEIKEMTRVLKNQGWIVICNGDDDIKREKPNQELIQRGFQVFYHQSSIGGDIYNYIKQVSK